MRPRTFKSRRGFTLLELVLVLLLMCICVAIAAPSLRGFWHGSRIKDAGDQIMAVTRWSRTQAISDGTIYRLNMDPSGNSYWLTMQSAEGFIRVPNEFGREYGLPDDARIDLMKLDGSAADHVDFFPNGRTEPSSIKISASGQNDIVLTCPTPTETFMLMNNGVPQ